MCVGGSPVQQAGQPAGPLSPQCQGKAQESSHKNQRKPIETISETLLTREKSLAW